MDITEAIRRAEQWRKDGACGPAAVVAIALLNELEGLQPVVAGWRRMIRERAEVKQAADPDTLAQAQSKVNDDMLAAQRNLLLREDGYPNAPAKP